MDIEKILAEIHDDMIEHREYPQLNQALGALARAYGDAYCAQASLEAGRRGSSDGAA